MLALFFCSYETAFCQYLDSCPCEATRWAKRGSPSMNRNNLFDRWHLGDGTCFHYRFAHLHRSLHPQSAFVRATEASFAATPVRLSFCRPVSLHSIHGVVTPLFPTLLSPCPLASCFPLLFFNSADGALFASRCPLALRTVVSPFTGVRIGIATAAPAPECFSSPTPPLFYAHRFATVRVSFPRLRPANSPHTTMLYLLSESVFVVPFLDDTARCVFFA